MDTATVTLLITLGVFSYDTVLLRFPDGVFPGVDLYALLRDVEPTHEGIKGWLGNAFVLIDGAGTLVSLSLPTYWHGSNAYALLLEDVRGALERLCLQLGIDFLELAATRVFRVDAGVNLPLAHRVAAYVGLCVEVPRADRLPFGKTGVAFTNSVRQLALYDKVKQLCAKGTGVPAEWADRELNVGRFEVRFMKQLTREFGRPIYAPDLWDEVFFESVVLRAVDRFRRIRFARSLTVPPLTSVRTAWDWAALHGIRSAIGEARFFELINDAREAGAIGRTQASRLRAKLRTAAQDSSFTTPSDLAVELTQAIESAAQATLE